MANNARENCLYASMHARTHTHIPQPQLVSSSKMSSEVGDNAAGDETPLKDGVGERAMLKEGGP